MERTLARGSAPRSHVTDGHERACEKEDINIWITFRIIRFEVTRLVVEFYCCGIYVLTTNGQNHMFLTSRKVIDCQ